MKTSEHLEVLAKALAKAQSEMGGAVKDSANPFFKSKYADLTSVWRACKDALHSNGFSVVQSPVDRDGRIGVSTMLLHSSGQYISDEFTLGVKKHDDPQADGSSITYARRYALAAFVGVCPVDDDGEKAMNRKGQKAEPKFQGHHSQQAGPPVGDKTWNGAKADATAPQLSAIRKTALKKAAMTEPDIEAFVTHIYGCKVEELTKEQASNIIGNFDSLYGDYTQSRVKA